MIGNRDLSRQELHGNVPTGEIYTATVEDTTNGCLAIYGIADCLGAVEQQVL